MIEFVSSGTPAGPGDILPEFRGLPSSAPGHDTAFQLNMKNDEGFSKSPRSAPARWCWISPGRSLPKTPRRRKVPAITSGFLECTIADLAGGDEIRQRKRITSSKKCHRKRIEEIDRRGPALHAVIEWNPDAVDIARQLDHERATKGPRGPLHGIPVLIKDNIDTHDRMMTTAGSLALLGSIAPRDAFVAQKLRDAGAVILGKTNLTEWANFSRRSFHQRLERAWQGRRRIRTPWITNHPAFEFHRFGPWRCPAICAVAVSRHRNRRFHYFAGHCLVALWGSSPRWDSSAGRESFPSPGRKTPPARWRELSRTRPFCSARWRARTRAMRRPKRRAAKYSTTTPNSSTPTDSEARASAWLGDIFCSAGISSALLETALDDLRRLGATLVDPADDPALGNFGGAESIVLSYEFKAGINAYLASLGPGAPMRTLQDLIAFNEKEP